MLEWRLYEAGHCMHPELATLQGGRLAPCAFPALVAALRHPVHGRILFDTGYAHAFFAATARFPERLYRWATPVHLQEGESLVAQLARDGIAAGDIAWVVVSHLHGDHVGGLADFPQARIACAREAVDWMRARGRIGALRKGVLPALFDSATQARMEAFEARRAVALEGPFARFGVARDLFDDGSLLAIPLPGHAPGHYGLLFRDADGPVFLVADASWSSHAIRAGIPPPAAVTGWLGDTDAYRTTLAHLHALHREAPHVRLVPAHCREWRPARQGLAHA